MFKVAFRESMLHKFRICFINLGTKKTYKTDLIKKNIIELIYIDLH